MMFIKKLLLNLYYWPMFALVTILTIILIPFIILFEMVFLGMKMDQAVRWLIGMYGWILVKAIPFFGPVIVDYRAGKLPETCIYVPNHTSSIEPYLFAALWVEAGFVTTWPFKIPLYGSMMRKAGYINAEYGWEEMKRQSIAFLRNGPSLIIWPEGHRSRDGKIGRFKNGAFAISVETGIPIVPVCILGADKVLPPGKKSLTPHRVRLIVLEPVYPETAGDEYQRIINLRDKVKKAICKTLQENADWR